MKKRVLEESVLFISIIKWFFLATGVGVLVGLSTTIFLKSLEASIALTTQYTYYFLLLPVAFFISSLLTKYISPEAEGHGTEKVIESFHKRSGKINPLVVPVKLAATVITIALGGSAGKEGPCAQIGAGLSSTVSGLFKFNDNDQKKISYLWYQRRFCNCFWHSHSRSYLRGRGFISGQFALRYPFPVICCRHSWLPGSYFLRYHLFS